MSGWAALGLAVDKGLDFIKMDRQNTYNKRMAQNALTYRVEDAKRNKIHPLAALGANVVGSSPVSVGSESGFQNLGQNLDNRNAAKARNEAELKNINKQTELLDTQIKNMGGNSSEYTSGPGGNAPPGQQTDDYSSNPNNPMQKNVEIGQRYTIDRQKNFYPIPTQSVEQAFSEEGTLQNRFMYEMREAWFPAKVAKLRRNWNNFDPEFKRNFLATRPVPNPKTNPNVVVLWNGTNWQGFTKTSKNAHRIFTGSYPTMRPRKTKRRNKKRASFSDLPVSP